MLTVEEAVCAGTVLFALESIWVVEVTATVEFLALSCLLVESFTYLAALDSAGVCFTVKRSARSTLHQLYASVVLLNEELISSTSWPRLKGCALLYAVLELGVVL